MGRPKKVKQEDATKDIKDLQALQKRNWEKREDLSCKYDQALQEYSWLYQALEKARKDLEKALTEKIVFEKENVCKWHDLED